MRLWADIYSRANITLAALIFENDRSSYPCVSIHHSLYSWDLISMKDIAFSHLRLVKILFHWFLRKVCLILLTKQQPPFLLFQATELNLSPSNNQKNNLKSKLRTSMKKSIVLFVWMDISAYINILTWQYSIFMIADHLLKRNEKHMDVWYSREQIMTLSMIIDHYVREINSNFSISIHFGSHASAKQLTAQIVQAGAVHSAAFDSCGEDEWFGLGEYKFDPRKQCVSPTVLEFQEQYLHFRRVNVDLRSINVEWVSIGNRRH